MPTSESDGFRVEERLARQHGRLAAMAAMLAGRGVAANVDASYGTVTVGLPGVPGPGLLLRQVCGESWRVHASGHPCCVVGLTIEAACALVVTVFGDTSEFEVAVGPAGGPVTVYDITGSVVDAVEHGRRSASLLRGKDDGRTRPPGPVPPRSWVSVRHGELLVVRLPANSRVWMPDDISAWRNKMKWSPAEAAAELHVGLDNYLRFEQSCDPIGGTVQRLCELLEERVHGSVRRSGPGRAGLPRVPRPFPDPSHAARFPGTRH